MANPDTAAPYAETCLGMIDGFEAVSYTHLCKKLCKFIQWGLVHVISTDTHSPDKRPPRMAQGVQQLSLIHI